VKGQVVVVWRTGRSRARWAVLLALAAGAVVLAGCGGSDGNTPAFEYPTGVDPDGGTWQTVVIGSVADYELPAPPESTTTALEAEVQELRQYQADRTPGIRDTVRTSKGWTVLRWNEIARGLVASTNTPPTMAARAYAMLSVAQYDALIAAWHNKYLHNRTAPTDAVADLTNIVEPLAVPCYPSEDAVVAAASYEVLRHVFPERADWLQEQLQTRSVRSGTHPPTEVMSSRGRCWAMTWRGRSSTTPTPTARTRSGRARCRPVRACGTPARPRRSRR
jgi:hypothetical protein